MSERRGLQAHVERKAAPICTGVLDYFPDALLEIARVSKAGNDQHNPGEPLHWAREKSGDHADCVVRHLVDRGKRDVDGQRHTAKAAWRVLALLQLELEAQDYDKHGALIDGASMDMPVRGPLPAGYRRGFTNDA